jgi:peptidoglycan hydrolase-like protein with peptidoglycan-binding domain
MSHIDTSHDERPNDEQPPPTVTPPRRKPREISYEPYRHGVKVGGRSVGVGNVGADVRRLQRMLNRRGVTLVEDGVFGPLTEISVKKFQRQVKVKVDGVVGRQTWAELGW